MKRFSAILSLLFISGLLFGCSSSSPISNKQEDTVLYSFCGENENCSIKNGVFLMSPQEKVLYGGILSVDEEEFKDITAFTTSFYVSLDDGKEILLSNSISDLTGNPLNLNKETGSISGGSFAPDILKHFEDNLFFELNAYDKNGNNKILTIPMNVTLITMEKDK